MVEVEQELFEVALRLAVELAGLAGAAKPDDGWDYIVTLQCGGSDDLGLLLPETIQDARDVSDIVIERGVGAMHEWATIEKALYVAIELADAFGSVHVPERWNLVLTLQGSDRKKKDLGIFKRESLERAREVRQALVDAGIRALAERPRGAPPLRLVRRPR
jgi:hypothetical protein